MTKSKLMFLIFLFGFLCILAKLFLIQIISPRSSSDPYLTTQKIPAERGRIFDRNGKPLALNQNSYLLYLEPQKISDEQTLVRSLAPILHIQEASLEARIDKTKVWEAIRSGLDESTKNAIAALHLPGVGFDYSTQRYYPEASLSAHVLGFVGKNSQDENVGYFGLEGYYNKDLKGLPGILESERDPLGKPMLIGTQDRVDPENGRDLVLTIDKAIQDISKQKLLEGLKLYDAKQGCTITADPNTMQILALVCLPDYDPSQYYQFTQDEFKNPAISEIYEPGSIFKPLVMAAAVQEKKVQPNDIYDEKGPVQIGAYHIQTWDNTYEGKITMTRILEKSSNVGMVYVGSRLGDDKLYEYIQKFGFGQLTGIDLQGETAGYIKPKKDWYPIDFATATFGQGIAVTPMQMIRAFASVINGGKLLKPYVVKEMESSGQTQKINPQLERNVISPLTSDILKKMLVATVEHGEVRWARPKGYLIGGKTGTAQVPIKGVYDPSKTIASFIGFAPANDPKFITLVMLREPKASPWGSETAAPIFFEIAKQLLVYYNIPPSQ